MVFSASPEIGASCGMALSESALDVELALGLGISPRLETNPRSESNIHILIFNKKKRWVLIQAETLTTI